MCIRDRITIDTEGDNLWNNPRTITTHNARLVPRFQALCEQYGFKPTYLMNYEMACDAEFTAFLKEKFDAGLCLSLIHISSDWGRSITSSAPVLRSFARDA